MGPMLGQASHFARYAPPGQDYAIERYTREMDRLLAVLENNLSNNTYVAGNEYSIADIAVWPFVHGLSVMGLDLATLPALSRWINRDREEHTSALQSLMRTSYAVFRVKKKNTQIVAQVY